MQIGHTHTFVFLKQRVGQWIAIIQQRLRNLDDFPEPLGIADFCQAPHVGADGFASADGMAGRALRKKQILTWFITRDCAGLFITLAGGHGLGAVPVVHPVADHDRHKSRVVERVIALPLPGGFIANQQMRRMAVAIARRDNPGTPTATVAYYFSDHLKTASVVTDSAGHISADSDYYPWGGELQFVNADSNHYKFTGKERDTETNLDYFGARYYSNGLGRFITPDWAAKPAAVPYAEYADPQSLNLYTYVRNGPSMHYDSDGHVIATISGAVIGGLVGGTIEKLHGGSFWKGAASGAVSGAITGSIIDTGGASIGVLALAGAAGGVGGGIVNRALHGERTTASSVAKDATIGAVTGVVGGKVSEAIVNKIATKVIQRAAIRHLPKWEAEVVPSTV
jgi:RHS repeat-associated protein